MIDSKDMSDEEFIEFINANKERMETLMGQDEDFKVRLKESSEKAKKKLIEAEENAEDSVKKIIEAIFSKDVQKHVIGAGVEIALGFRALMKAMPVPEKAQPVVDKISEIKDTASSVYCAKNPHCPRRTAEEHRSHESMRIEID